MVDEENLSVRQRKEEISEGGHAIFNYWYSRGTDQI